MTQITMSQIEATIKKLGEIFGNSGSKVELFNDLDKVCIYSINTHYSISKNTLKYLKMIKGKITFIDFDQNGLRLLVEVRN